MSSAEAEQWESEHEDEHALPLADRRVHSGVVRKRQRPADPTEAVRPAAAPAARTSAIVALLAVVALGYCSLYLLDEQPSRAGQRPAPGSKY